MWQMYAIFEEVVGSQPESLCGQDGELKERSEEQHVMTPTSTPLDKNTASPQPPEDRGTRGSLPDVRKEDVLRQPLRSSPRFGSPRAMRKRMSGSHRQYHHRCHHRTRSEPSSNPLLDTISVLTYDPCDSDDYYDLNTVYQHRRILRSDDKSRASLSSHYHGDGDRDSIGYTGSNSIDSGYKSLCPTPEIPDSSYYGADAPRGVSSGGTDSSSSNSSPSRPRDASKPKIMMGTRVMNRQCPKQRSNQVPGSRHSDCGFYDVNLDHLMYLRQSLLSAIQRCESSSSPPRDGSPQSSSHAPRRGTAESPRRGKSPHSDRSGQQDVVTEIKKDTQQQQIPSSSSSSLSSPSYQKTVRFDTDTRMSSPSKSQHGVGKRQSKSILKDPLCANLRAQLESGVRLGPDCTLEEEIDSLLYGRAEYYDLESVDDFPCSYVTMIEEKYRCGKSSVAKVRRLKERSGEPADQQQAQSQPPSPYKRDGTPEQRQTAPKSPGTTRKDTDRTQLPEKEVKSLGAVAKSRFTEVAKCMLEIIEDLQFKKHLECKKEGTAASLDEDGLKAPASGRQEGQEENSHTEVASTSSYSSTADYHVYEEIAYDFVGSGTPPNQMEVPPPLPARPSVMLPKPDHHQQQQRAPCSGTVSSSSSASPSEELPSSSGLEESVRNRPKQRSNLYSLFTDRAERRSISRSLEREWRASYDAGETDDEYGFKRAFPSV